MGDLSIFKDFQEKYGNSNFFDRFGFLIPELKKSVKIQFLFNELFKISKYIPSYF